MNRRNVIIGGLGCALLLFLVAVAFIMVSFFPFTLMTETEGPFEEESNVVLTQPPEISATQAAVPTLDGGVENIGGIGGQEQEDLPIDISLSDLYSKVNPGVVNIQVFITEGLGGQGAGSGFILDEAGHIVTNNHVVAGADAATVIFYNGFEASAEVVGLDDDSDLAVLRVESIPEGAHPLPLGDSDQIETGEWVVAIGNPFSLGGSITLGIISALGRSIPSGVTPFAIPQAIQTDAAINPGNSGGPLLNLDGQVIGVNAQIRTTGQVAANSGVGFAIPVNVVRRVVPVLIAQGSFQWSWIGINLPASVNLLLAQANNLDTQEGVYIHEVVPGGPADEAGLQGSTGSTNINGLQVPIGGDVIVGINGEPLAGVDELLSIIAFTDPGTQMTLQVLRNGQIQDLNITLAARPQNFEPNGQ